MIYMHLFVFGRREIRCVFEESAERINIVEIEVSTDVSDALSFKDHFLSSAQAALVIVFYNRNSEAFFEIDLDIKLTHKELRREGIKGYFLGTV